MGDTGKARKTRNKNTSEQSKVSENVEKHPAIVKSEVKLHGNCIQGEEKHRMMESILARIAEGEPLRQICREENMPGWVTVYSWLDSDPNFAERFARARDKGEDAIAQECMDIADNATNDWMERYDKDGEKCIGWQINGDHVQRSKLRIETRLKLLAKWNPKKWGERQTVDMNVTNPVADRLARARKRNAG